VRAPVADLSDILLVLFGFVLGYAVKRMDDWSSGRRARKRLAAVLADEVEAIRAIASHSLEVVGPDVEGTRKILERGGSPVSSVGIDDVDYPTSVFDSSLTDLRLLGEEMMLKLTELHRWIDFTHHQKRLNLKYADEFMEVGERFAERAGPTDIEKDLLRSSALGSFVHGTQYLKNQSRILELTTQAVKDLERIGKTQVAGRVGTSTGEPLRASTGDDN